MSLSKHKREQVIALGRLGWPLRRIEQATGVRRETAGDYLRSAGIVVRPPGTWGPKSLSKAATLVISPALTIQNRPTNQSGHFGDHRLFVGKSASETDWQAICGCQRSVPRDDRAGAVTGPQRDGYLPGSGRRARVSRWLPERQAFRAQAAWSGIA